MNSPPIPRARPGDGRHDQLGIFQTALLGRITPVSTGPVVPSLGRVPVAVEDAVKVEPVGEFELKGMLPLAAYNVVHAVS